MDLNKIPSYEDGCENVSWEGDLTRDHKIISRVICNKPPPFPLPRSLEILDFASVNQYSLSDVPSFEMVPIPNTGPQPDEWLKYLKYTYDRRKVSVIEVDGWQLLIKPPSNGSFSRLEAVSVCYWRRRSNGRASPCFSSKSKIHQNGHGAEWGGKAAAARMHPEYLTTLSQVHASWLFGGIAELVDNARDAGAKRLDISVKSGRLKKENREVPMLCISDNGAGMNHEDILRMVSFGHKKPDEDDVEQIGRFGVGFKTGSMRIGKDAVVFTQSSETRSIALFSACYNEGKDVLEVPVVTYHRQHGRMEYDLRAHGLDEAKANEKAVIDYSPFDKYGIGHELASFGDASGTCIYIYNLEKWGAEYSLKWDDNKSDAKGDITLRSRRVRARPGQTSIEVPLDYSLRAYLEVIFLDPHMIISIQGSQVKTRRLRESLSGTSRIRHTLQGKEVELTLGHSQDEFKRANCGIFLYWHGRLIEAYKRVGNMVHSADWGRGVVGVIDITSLMEFGKGRVGVLNNKQGFEDSEAYANLERWLAEEADKYWEQNGEGLQRKKYNERMKPDVEWVQCNKCLKWRILKPDSGADSENLPDEWFCYMYPFNGRCETPEELPEKGVVTVGTKRHGQPIPEMNGDVESDDSEDSDLQPIRRYGRMRKESQGSRTVRGRGTRSGKALRRLRKVEDE